MDRRIRFEYAMCGQENFDSEKKKSRIQTYPGLRFLGAFHFTKNSDLHFRKFPVANGAKFS